MGEVAAVDQGQAQEGVTHIGQGVENGGIGLSPGVRLHIGPVGTKNRLGALNGQGLDDVDDFAAPVIATSNVGANSKTDKISTNNKLTNKAKKQLNFS